MGYRHYFYTVDIAECEAIRHLEYPELIEFCKENYPDSYDNSDDYEYIDFHKILNQKKIFGFGKLYWDDTAERIDAQGNPLFTVEETQKRFRDYMPYCMGKDGLKEAIKIYKGKIINYYKSLLVDDTEYEALKSSEKLKKYADDMLFWWEKMGVLNLNESYESISSSWLYEHQIFELVRLYKSIDWSKNYLLFYGW